MDKRTTSKTADRDTTRRTKSTAVKTTSCLSFLPLPLWLLLSFSVGLLLLSMSCLPFSTSSLPIQRWSKVQQLDCAEQQTESGEGTKEHTNWHTPKQNELKAERREKARREKKQIKQQRQREKWRKERKAIITVCWFTVLCVCVCSFLFSSWIDPLKERSLSLSLSIFLSLPFSGSTPRSSCLFVLFCFFFSSDLNREKYILLNCIHWKMNAKGADNVTTKRGQRKVRGTTPGKAKWSYYTKEQEQKKEQKRKAQKKKSEERQEEWAKQGAKTQLAPNCSSNTANHAWLEYWSFLYFWWRVQRKEKHISSTNKRYPEANQNENRTQQKHKN